MDNATASPIDRRLVYATAGLRSFGYGYTSVLLGPYLKSEGFSPLKVGILLTTALVGGLVLTLAASLWGDRLGRRRALAGSALLATIGAVVVAMWPNFAPLLAVTLLGAINPTGQDRGAFNAVESAMLPQMASARERTWVFSRYNLVAALAASFGALAAGAPTLLRHVGAGEQDAFRVMFLLYAAAMAVLALLYLRLSHAVEAESADLSRPRLIPAKSRRIIGGLAALFALDAFGGGLVVQSYLAYWFNLKFGFSLSQLGYLFFATGMAASFSFLVAAKVSEKIGLVNTMVFTHLPSNILLFFVPLAPNAASAVALLLARQALSQMDVPTRQSYTMAVVAPEERTAAGGITAVSRTAAQSASPSLSGWMTHAVGLSGPLLLAASIKGFYDLVLWTAFRKRKPPEEG
ncbi:MAG: MFS transporter [Chloroflexi bacterium]|nr:MFS transporter [Chloroflexota bacterium]